jgi:hypothetical protein
MLWRDRSDPRALLLGEKSLPPVKTLKTRGSHAMIM